MRAALKAAGFSKRAINALWGHHGCGSLADVANLRERDVLLTPNLGRKSLNEIKTVLASHGLSLIQPPEAPPTKLHPADALKAEGLTPRAAHCLANLGFATLEQVTIYSGRDLLREPNLGRGTLSEIESTLAQKGLALAG